MHHPTSQRVRAHFFVAYLGFLLDRALEKKFEGTGIDLSSRQAWLLLNTVRAVEIDLRNGHQNNRSLKGAQRQPRS